MSKLEDKLKEKKKNIKKKITAKKDKVVKKIKPTKTNAESKNKNKEKLHPPMYEMLVVIVNRGMGEIVANYLKTLKLDLSIISFGEGTAPTNIQSLLGYSQEKEVLYSIVNIDYSTKVLDLLDSIFLSTEKYAGIAFTIPLKSMTDKSLEEINASNVSKESNGGKR